MTSDRPNKCDICGSSKFKEIDFSFHLFGTTSNQPEFHQFRNYVCDGCGVIQMFPQPSEQKLIEYYNSEYRQSPYALKLGEKNIDTPVNFDSSIQSFQRFKTFYETIERDSRLIPGLTPASKDTLLDMGGYQGVFAYAATCAWGCKAMICDYNQAGINFARQALDLTESIVAKDINTDLLPEKIKFVTLIHSFEHLRHPAKFLKHLKENILLPDGFLYLEIPNALGSHLSNPTHFFMYTEDSLRFTLENSGFDIIELGFTGFPREHLLIGHPQENLICLARLSKSEKKPLLTGGKADRVYAQMQKNYRDLSRKALVKLFRQLLGKGKYFLNQFYSILIADRFPPKRG